MSISVSLSAQSMCTRLISSRSGASALTYTAHETRILFWEKRGFSGLFYIRACAADIAAVVPARNCHAAVRVSR